MYACALYACMYMYVCTYLRVKQILLTEPQLLHIAAVTALGRRCVRDCRLLSFSVAEIVTSCYSLICNVLFMFMFLGCLMFVFVCFFRLQVVRLGLCTPGRSFGSSGDFAATGRTDSPCTVRCFVFVCVFVAVRCVFCVVLCIVYCACLVLRGLHLALRADLSPISSASVFEVPESRPACTLSSLPSS